MASKKRAILWDNDGMLVDTEGLYFKATRRVLSRIKITLTEKQYIDISLTKGESMFSFVKGRSVSEIEGLREKRDALYAKLIRKEKITIPGAGSTLKALHGKVMMGVVTSSRRDQFKIIHKRTGFLKYFDFTLCAEDFKRSKPYPDPYLLGVKRSGFSAKECIAIEDSERGLRSAHAAGVECIVIPDRWTRGQDFSLAVKVCKNRKELLRFLQKII